MSMNYCGFSDPPLSFPLGAETQNRVETPDRTRPDNVRAHQRACLCAHTRTQNIAAAYCGRCDADLSGCRRRSVGCRREPKSKGFGLKVKVISM